MRITIDTKHDSHAEIKHAIDILQNLLQRQGTSDTPVTPVATEQQTASMMSMFDSSPASAPEPQPQQNNVEVPDMNAFFAMAREKQEEEKQAEESGEPSVEYF